MNAPNENAAAGSALEAMASQFQDLVRSMVDGDRGLQLEAVLNFARSAISGADHAAISLALDGRDPRTTVSTGELPVRVDALQYSFNEGPCVTALDQSDLVWVDDLASDERFPRFAPAAAELGVRSMLSTRLFLSERDHAALNLYSLRPGAFEAEHISLAAIFASYASLLLMNQLHEDRAMRLERALESNREIGVAMGILMAQKRWSQSEAFERLVNASQHLNRRLQDIAAEVRATMKLPSFRQQNG